MEPFALKLEMLKGPREGEAIEYRPGSKIRIGRVVRGNNLPIKDFGISTNHLIIESSESGQWVIRDLGSSNGTIVNAAKLDPNTPSELSDGDEIKIGEYTSIRVKIDGRGDESRPRRRNPRRGAVGRGRVADESEMKAEAAVENDAAAAALEKGRPVGRRGRVAKKNEVRVEAQVENDEVIGGAAAAEKVGVVGGRGKKKEVNSEVEREGEEIEVVEKPKRGRGRGQGRGRPAKNGRVLESEDPPVAVLEVSSRENEKTMDAEVVSDSMNCNVKIEPKRRGRGRKKKNVEEEPLDVVAEKDFGEAGTIGDGLVELKDSGVDGKGLNLEDEKHEEAGVDVGESGDGNEKAKGSNSGHEEGAIDCNVGESCDKVGSDNRSCSGVSGAKSVHEKGSGYGVKERPGKVWQEPDLEKMTLDDWFDYVEYSWPKVVNEEIEKICAGMREKAKLVHQYIEQHKKEKGQG